jgi:hypothetical protein
VTTIPLTTAGQLARIGRRTAALRLVLALIVAGSAVAAIGVARHPNTHVLVPLSARGDTIVVLDLSASIGSDTYSRIGSTLSSLARSKGRYGLVVFSGQAYEALPPGSPAEDLAPLVRFFVPQKASPGFAPTYPRNPWTDVFSAGTRISSGLELGHEIALAGGGRSPAVVLVSDLDDDPADLPRLASIVLAYRRDDIPLRIVALNPSSQNAAFFQRLAGPSTPIVQAGAATPGPRPRNHTPVPWTFVLLVVAGAAAVAAHELWTSRLEWEPAR